MDSLDTIRYMIESVQNCMRELLQLQKTLSEYLDNKRFVPDDLRESLINGLYTLKKLEINLDSELNKEVCGGKLSCLSDAIEALEQLAVSKSHNELVQQLECVEMSDEEDSSNLGELIDKIRKAVTDHDYDNMAIKIGRAFLHDLNNKKVEEMKTLKEFKKDYAYLMISVYDGTARLNDSKSSDSVREETVPSEAVECSGDKSIISTAEIAESITEPMETEQAESIEEDLSNEYEEETEIGKESYCDQTEPQISIEIEARKAKKKFSVTECLNLMTGVKYNNRIPHPIYLFIVRCIDEFGAFTLDFIRTISIKESEKIGKEIDLFVEKLVKVDVLSKITAGETEIYYLSANGKKLFENKTFKQVFFKNMGLHHIRSGERFEAGKWDVAATLAFEKTYIGFVGSCPQELCPKSFAKMYSKNLPGFRMFDFSSTSGSEFFFTAFMYLADDMLKEYKRALLDDADQEKYNNIRIFVLASTDIGKCKAVYSEIKEQFSVSCINARVIYFSFNDQTFYDPDDEEAITIEAVVSELKESIDSISGDHDDLVSENDDVDSENKSQKNITDELCDDSFDANSGGLSFSDKEDDVETGKAVPEESTADHTSLENKKTEADELIANVDPVNKKDIISWSSKIEYAPEKERIAKISYDDAVKKAEEMLVSDAKCSALAYLKMASIRNSEIVPVYEMLAFALDDPAMNKHYSSNEILSLIGKIDLEDTFIQSLLISATMRTVFYNDSKFDYDMISLRDIIPRTSVTEIHTFIQRCIDFKNKHCSGFDLYCDYRNKEQIAARKEIESICKDAKSFYDANIESPFKEKTKIKRYRDTYQKIFDRDSLLSVCIEIVANNNKEEIGFAREFISEYIKGDKIDVSNINEDAVDRLIDDTWDECCEDKVLFHSTPLVSGLRAKLKNRITCSLAYIAKWISNNDICDSIGRTADDSEKNFMLKCLESISSICRQEMSKSRSQAVLAGYKCIVITSDNLRSRVDGSYDGTAYKRFFYVNMLKTGDVMLKDDGNGAFVPELSDYCYGVSGYTVEDRIIRNYEHFVKTNGFEGVMSDFGDSEYCDLQAASILSEYYYHIGEVKDFKESLERKLEGAKGYEKQLNRQRVEFIEELELKKSYGVFDANHDDDIKELLLRQSDNVYNYSKASTNYGFYKRALDYIRLQIKEDSETQRDRIKKSLNDLCSDEIIIEKEREDPVLRDALDKAKVYMESGNYTASEDLINRIISGDLSSIELKAPNPDLSDFQRCYREMYDACYSSSGAELKSSQKIKKLIDRYSKAMKDAKSASRLANLWISNGTNENRMQELLCMLGMDCIVTSDFEKGTYNHQKYYFDCTLKGDVNTSGRFSHVIAPFGSLAHNTSFRTLCLFGKNDDERMFNEIDKLTSFKKSTIIFVDYTFNEQFRRELSDHIKRGKYGEIYMVIDRVMFLYFVTHFQTESIIGRFMNVAMPYSYYQPYVFDSMSKMPPEMFFGRTDELQKIEDRNGIHMLYGGRQLGKSALLKRAKLSINGISGQKAVYIDIKNKTVPEVAKMICDEMMVLGLFDGGQIYDEWGKLCKALKESMIQNKISYFLLLLDEGDKFIEDCKKYEYAPIEEMKRIMEDISFKFVIAGLHNLARYNHESAVKNNSVIPHLNTLTIKPFRNLEARKLLEVPLAQVGLFFNNDALISTILATTNYFPGLIQLYCSKLITSLQDIDKTIYPVSKVPPYYINEKHIQKVLANKEFTQQIKEKFEITLELDNDNYYQIIALLMAEMYHSDDVMNHSVGYGADEVYERGCGYGIKKISDLDLDVFTVYMDELVELNIFRKHPDNSYTFLRQNFFQLMGNSDEIYDRLQKYMDEC